MANIKIEYLDRLTNEYLPAFLAFGIKNISNLHEAEEFSQETAYQCVLAINKADSISNFNAFIWSVAHNTYKRWCARKKHVSFNDDSQYDTLSNIISSDTPIEEAIIQEEDNKRIRLELSRLIDLYRKTMVCFYYDELSITETSDKLGISVEMVKFYLQKGRKKLREAYTMSKTNIGEKSFNPSEFSVYKSAIDFSAVNVWEVFKRKLPCQIALICHDSNKTVSEISLETGVAAVYIEDEIGLLMDAGVMISPVRSKYRTNLFILKKNVLTQIKEQFNMLYEAYIPAVLSAYDKYLPELEQTGIFKHDVPEGRYAWFYADKVSDFDYSEHELSDSDYPQILSCGSKGFIFAEEAEHSAWTAGQTPTRLEQCTVWSRDINVFRKHHRQRELQNNGRKCQALYDTYIGQKKDSDNEIYAQLIEEGYVVKIGGSLFCNIAVSTPEARKLFNKINSELAGVLVHLCNEIRENIGRVVKSTIPPQLKDYTKGYTETWIMFYSGVYFMEALYNKGFISIPEPDDKTPVACYIYEN